jgi:hypothetical protein
MEHIDIKEIGISGWLSPEGEFIPAEYGKHEQVALSLESENLVSPVSDILTGCVSVRGERLLELTGYIKFTCRHTGIGEQESYVFFPQQFGCTRDVTNEQVEFIHSNYNYMTSRQKSYVRQYMKYAYGIAV